MEANYAKCPKCEKMILSSNLLLHTSTCKGRQVQDLFSQSKNNENITSLNKNNNRLSVNNPPENFTFNNINPDDDIYHCATCDLYLDISQKGDHILSHQYENEVNLEESDEHEDSEEDTFINRSNQINSMHNIGLNTNLRRNQQNTNNVQNIQTRISNNGNTRTETRVVQHRDGTVTTITSTTSNNGGYPNDRSLGFRNYGEGVQLQSLPGYSINNTRNSRLSFPGILTGNIFQGHNDIQSLFQSILQSVNNEHPVSDDILNVLPEITIEDVNKLPAEKKDCVICLNKYDGGDKVLILPCTHLFHTNCIKDWFKAHDTCPICKYKIDQNAVSN